MAGTSKKSQGATERKMRILGNTLKDEELDVQVLTTNDLYDEDIKIKSMKNGNVRIFKAKDRKL